MRKNKELRKIIKTHSIENYRNSVFVGFYKRNAKVLSAYGDDDQKKKGAEYALKAGQLQGTIDINEQLLQYIYEYESGRLWSLWRRGSRALFRKDAERVSEMVRSNYNPREQSDSEGQGDAPQVPSPSSRGQQGVGKVSTPAKGEVPKKPRKQASK